jgi:hypothetical protein
MKRSPSSFSDVEDIHTNGNSRTNSAVKRQPYLKLSALLTG